MRGGTLGIALTAALIGCGDDDRPMPDGGDDGAIDAAPDAAGDSGFDAARDAALPCRGHVTGRVRYPSGTHTVGGALVYVSATGVAPTRSGECEQCLETDSLLAWTVTTLDGRFELDLPPGSREIVIEKGLFERRLTVEVGCEPMALDERATALPGRVEEGRLPRIAVVTGVYDAIEVVLAKLGLGEVSGLGFSRMSFDLFDGEYLEDTRLLGLLRTDGALAASYDYLFVNCGSALEMVLGEPAVAANIRGFVEHGGRLYVTDQAYDSVEQLFPEAIDFAGGSGDGLGAIPEPLNLAESGDDVPRVEGVVHDEMLRQWLDLHGLLLPDGRLAILHLIGGWAMMEAAAEPRTRTLVSGPAGGRERPLTVAFDYGCGRVLYTSYHTVEPYDGSPFLTAQETLLGYLAFELGSCIEEPVGPF